MSAVTATTSTGPEAPARVRQRAATRAARRRFLRTLLVAGAWFWACWALLVLSLPLIVERWGGEADGLTYDAAGGPVRWVAFAVGVIVTVGTLTVHVAAGGTRRSFVEGGLRAAAITGPVLGALAVALTFAERAVYADLDRYWQGPAAPLGIDSPTGVVVQVVGEALVVVTYLLVGIAVVAGYRRAGAWRGSLLVVPLLVPCALADLATRTGLFGIPLRGGYDDVALGVVGAVGGTLVAAALAAVVASRMLRQVPCRP
ncbi:hypothetical protein [Krasilnikoviella flava]|uniref:ABC-2 family transporter protein n=1 Tax=Krasilnikoviella flava TaxID=526729 RepID=A0A1T5INR4_9MICO|nr:hypothetical protein [Krasilnikoviella flava]SKC40785.1 hypothetical protein SAMN04324258_0745 [Krasilnikoviella flava]